MGFHFCAHAAKVGCLQGVVKLALEALLHRLQRLYELGIDMLEDRHDGAKVHPKVLLDLWVSGEGDGGGANSCVSVKNTPCVAFAHNIQYYTAHVARSTQQHEKKLFVILCVVTYCTFTTTLLPSCFSRARCTCPIDAAPVEKGMNCMFRTIAANLKHRLRVEYVCTSKNVVKIMT